MVQLGEPGAGPTRRRERGARSPWGHRGRTTRRGSAALHRWLALVVGTVLLVELVSGTVLLFRPELFAAGHPELFAATASAHPIGPEQAVAVVRRDVPGLAVGDTTWTDGVWQVGNTAFTRTVYVDPGSGRILGEASPTRGILGFLMNLHDCFLACEGYAGYVPALASTVPGLGELTWANLVLGVVGLGFAVLAVSGVVAWWPSMRRFLRDLRTSLTVHARRGQYRLHRDLHDVLAVVALPLLVVWAVTGAGYALPVVGDAWYALTGGAPATPPAFTTDPAPAGTRDVGIAGAVAAARRAVPGEELVAVAPPSEEIGPGYTVGLQSGVAPARYAGLRSFAETTVTVDPVTGRAEVTAGGPDEALNEWLWTSGNYGVHFGYMVPWWARTVWLAAGLVSVYLVGSGFWTWWWRTRLRRRRRTATPAVTPSGGSATPRAPAAARRTRSS